MPYEVVTASLNADKSGRIDVYFGTEKKTVIVSRRALLSAASPPRATEIRLLQYIDMFCEIAASRLGSTEMGDALLITANDVRRWIDARQSPEMPAHAASRSDAGTAWISPNPNRTATP
ncbi:hypothetical protein NE852_30210 (plasmid) [Rhizobium sp. Pop5]|uniref:hypothetical protein n=1 Tax=Rhizobium sp. Pop5 TaxID=1223565 RepID=UPI0002835F74|nr:hypothetical protein [Rhizobium sp. Pop5]EJZ22899.1 hypothetical protein RCCGEPOP_02376 [Rhizobium sp. Pop5]UVD60071.1 hypothetical protein NE852_30210 [Rhizobium sp. Pop5]